MQLRDLLGERRVGGDGQLVDVRAGDVTVGGAHRQGDADDRCRRRQTGRDVEHHRFAPQHRVDPGVHVAGAHARPVEQERAVHQHAVDVDQQAARGGLRAQRHELLLIARIVRRHGPAARCADDARERGVRLLHARVEVLGELLDLFDAGVLARVDRRVLGIEHEPHDDASEREQHDERDPDDHAVAGAPHRRRPIVDAVLIVASPRSLTCSPN